MRPILSRPLRASRCILGLAALLAAASPSRAAAGAGGPSCPKRQDGSCIPTDCTIDRARYDKVRQGMSVVDAFRAMDCVGRREIGADTYGTGYQVFRMDGAKAGSGALLHFENDALSDKVPIDLEP